MSTKTKAIYGGAFDPFHNGHLATVALLLNSALVDEVVVVPSGDRPDKESRACGMERLTMTRLAIEESFTHDRRVSVSDAHVAGRVGYGTIDLLDYYHRDGANNLLVVLGQELLTDLPHWKESGRLRATARFLVIQRPGVSPTMRTPAGWNITTLVPLYEDRVLVSSSSVRALLQQGLSCVGLVPACVLRYCLEHEVYKTKNGS